MPGCFAVVPAAGIGARMGEAVPKQYLELRGVTLLEHSLRSLLQCPDVGSIAVPLHADDRWAGELPVLADQRIVTTTGAAERSGSVLAGLYALGARAQSQDWVLVHDAARPCLRQAQLRALIAQVTSTGVGGLLAEPVVDTVKQVDALGRVEQTLDRSRLWRAQTPQMFRLGELVDALERAAREGAPVTDEASAMELAGYPVQIVVGDASNLKVTVAGDLALADWYLSQAPADA